MIGRWVVHVGGVDEYRHTAGFGDLCDLFERQSARLAVEMSPGG